MSNLSKRSTVYFEPDIHQALKVRAASANLSVSELIDEAVRYFIEKPNPYSGSVCTSRPSS
jgi:predicted HicB family RNase H-like nuclease